MPARPTILVAEDNPSDQLLLRRAIKRAGLEVDSEFVDDGVKAVHYLEAHERQQAPALLLLDLKMPVMDGFGVLEWLQQHPASRPEHVVVLSSCCAQNDLMRSMLLGVEHYVVKPEDPVEFAVTLKRLGDYCNKSGGPEVAAEEIPEAARELVPAA